MFPLELLPESLALWVDGPTLDLRGLVDLLPFKYFAYFPAAVFLGKIDGSEMYNGLAIEFGWVLFFIVLSWFLWWRGVKRYSGYGG